MEWKNLLFLHYSCPPEEVQTLLPRGLEVDTFPNSEGKESAWIGLVLFEMCRVHPPGLPALPLVSDFPEFNVRTYVKHGPENGQSAGVYFFSLDAFQPLAVAIARLRFHLPYYLANMSVERTSELLSYRSSRRGGSASCEVEATITGNVEFAKPHTLEHFLLERYLFMTPNPRTGTIEVGRVAHKPYQFRQVQEITVVEDGLVKAGGLQPRLYEHRVFVESVSVVGYRLRT
jgi:uncharacterized protein YqjF (DUF2071 family)